MKTILLLVTAGISLFSLSLKAAALDTPENARKVKKLISPSVLKVEGVNGIGITGCNPRTGKQWVTGDFVHCVGVMTATEEAAEELLERYPQGTKIKGVFITVKYIGEIKPQPNATGGN